jgi:hypothetical protein
MTNLESLDLKDVHTASADGGRLDWHLNTLRHHSSNKSRLDPRVCTHTSHGIAVNSHVCLSFEPLPVPRRAVPETSVSTVTTSLHAVPTKQPRSWHPILHAWPPFCESSDIVTRPVYAMQSNSSTIHATQRRVDRMYCVSMPTLPLLEVDDLTAAAGVKKSTDLSEHLSPWIRSFSQPLIPCHPTRLCC